MPKKAFGDAPFPPLVRIDTSEPVSLKQLSEILSSRPDGVTICVRSAVGHENRGGFFFHLKVPGGISNDCEIYNFEKIRVAVMSLDKTVAFVNHCAGLAFDDWAFHFCQSVINFRLDPD